MSSEFELIDLIRRRCVATDGVIVGIGDDASVLQPTANAQLVTTTDSVLLGQHFTEDWEAKDVGHLAMAVNLSDLASMGAKPRWALLSLSLPSHSHFATKDWLNAFLDGFLSVHPGVSLVGGNMANGEVNIGVCLIGEVAPFQAITRRGSQVGDCLVVTGALGDVAGALQLGSQSGKAFDALRQRMHHPLPRNSVGEVAHGFVHAMIDVSDGLLSDLGHLLDPVHLSAKAPELGARIFLDRLPTSDALMEAFPLDQDRWPLQLNGGSDYELLMSVAPDRINAWLDRLAMLNVPATVIGEITDCHGVALVSPDGQDYALSAEGWDAFR